jgi:D-alanine--poly(phosphoribitol) ligase subunit 1
MKYCFETKTFIEKSVESQKIALIDNDRSISWKQFLFEVEAFQFVLTQNNFHKTSNPVIIYGHKQAEMIIAMYACMCLNICYIPVDQIYPKDRIESICEISKPSLIINCSQNALNMRGISELSLSKNSIVFNNVNQLVENQKLHALDPLVYILFTSGSTGVPKGVQISSEAIASFSRWMSNDFGFSNNDIFFNIAVFSFDLSVFEIISFASLGATLVLNNKETCENQNLLLERLLVTKATVWVSTPSYAFIFSRIMEDIRFSSIHFFLFCGEVLSHSLAKSIKTHLPKAKVLNTYGPTEATVATSLVEITSELLEKYNPLPVGFPKRECDIYIEQGETNGPGEIIICGPHVSLGYLNREELNSEKYFVTNKLRAFRTGDLGYFQDGMLFCAGRNDDQIKWNGFRIELNEITNKLLEISSIKEAITIPLKRNGEVKKIISFVISEEKIDKQTLNNHLKEALSRSLPYYMIPGDIEPVDTFPYNQNFKIDKATLIEEYLKRQFS